MNKPELLAPAGSLEKAKTAFRYGADAVYMGTSNLSLRSRVTVDDDELIKTIEYAHSINKKVYAALNIYARDNMYEEIENQIKQKFKMKGLILADVNIIKKMDTKIEEQGTSSIIPAGIKKDGELSSRDTSAITKEQFENLQKYTDKIIKQISQEILSGNIDIKPYYNTKDKKTPCEYCSYKSICRFDEGQCNNYNYVGKLNREAVLEEIKNRIGD
jgi:ATP-dependent helicase/DNAse subunit B